MDRWEGEWMGSHERARMHASALFPTNEIMGIGGSGENARAERMGTAHSRTRIGVIV